MSKALTCFDLYLEDQAGVNNMATKSNCYKLPCSRLHLSEGFELGYAAKVGAKRPIGSTSAAAGAPEHLSQHHMQGNRHRDKTSW